MLWPVCLFACIGNNVCLHDVHSIMLHLPTTVSHSTPSYHPQMGCPLDNTNRHGNNVLLLASRAGNVEMMKYLIEERNCPLDVRNHGGDDIGDDVGDDVDGGDDGGDDVGDDVGDDGGDDGCTSM